MILGSHVIFGAYGFWLPNDPRGSWSDFVGSWELYRFGKATTTQLRRSVAGKKHNKEARLQTKESLRFPPVNFSGLQAQAVGQGFAESVSKGKVHVWACSILPEHVHMVLGKHYSRVETLVNFMKGAATKELLAKNIHPLAEWKNDGKLPHCWARGCWKVFLNSEEDVIRAINYVETNPEKEGKPRQKWSFVTPFHAV